MLLTIHAKYSLPRLKLPTGREITLYDALKLCYDINETDTIILIELMKLGEQDVDGLAKRLNFSKATVNRSLNKLVNLGFIKRRKEHRLTVGRPRFKYFIDDKSKTLNLIITGLKNCVSILEKRVEVLIPRI